MMLIVSSLAGYGYHRYYKSIVLRKIDNAFEKGDPALKLAGAGHQPWYHSYLPPPSDPDPGGGGEDTLP